MTKVTHTPGPWRIDRDNFCPDGYTIVGRPTWPCKRNGVNGEWDVAVIDTDNEDDKSNARLIAAAPELLEALEKVLAKYGPQHGPVAKEAHAAIAKARGEA